jgi:hypothetical protein
MIKTKTKQKILIITSIVVALIMMAAIFYFLSSRGTEEYRENINKEIPTTEDEDISSDDNNPSPRTNGESEFGYESNPLSAKSSFAKVIVTWDSLNSKKESKEIYLRSRVGGKWGEWLSYKVSLDPLTRNSTFTTGERTYFNRRGQG